MSAFGQNLFCSILLDRKAGWGSEFQEMCIFFPIRGEWMKKRHRCKLFLGEEGATATEKGTQAQHTGCSVAPVWVSLSDVATRLLLLLLCQRGR